MAGSSRRSGCLVWVIIIILVFALPNIFGNSNSSKSSTANKGATTQQIQSNTGKQGGATTAPKDPDANLTAQTPPANGTVLDGSEGGYSGVQVTASSDASAYVKVKDMSGYTVVGFFVSAGSTAEVYVPEGTYSVQFARGNTWYGPNDCFGSKTIFGQDREVTLGYGDVITYTLQLSSNGNFSMQSLNEAQF